jgi:D-serine deaminase-like pyridoxal phosphate-dependent protein
MIPLSALSTPCLLVDDSRLRDNIRRMQDTADTNEVALRPHTKTHKSLRIARRQQDAGAQGITVAKVAEAETFVRAGFDDVRVAYCVAGREKHERLAQLMDRARVSFCVDTEAGAKAASKVYADADRVAEVLIEVDVGHGRCGVPWDTDAGVRLARRIDELPGLRCVGILTHAGQGYHGPEDGETPEDALRRTSAAERDRMLDCATRLRDADIPGVTPDEFEISIGSTPTMRYFENRVEDGFAITEIRPGNYVFYDAIQVGLGAAEWDHCALTVLTTVISRRGDRCYLDAGKKVVTTDTGSGTDGYGTLLADPAAMTPLDGATITGLSEEHGWVRLDGDADLQVGDRVRFVPNHACVTVNTQNEMHLAEGPNVAGTLPVDARGAVT